MEVSFFTENWLALTVAAMAFIKVIVNLTPTEKDNMIFGYLDLIITAITGDRRKK
jgi:hypothetical protein